VIKIYFLRSSVGTFRALGMELGVGCGCAGDAIVVFLVGMRLSACGCWNTSETCLLRLYGHATRGFPPRPLLECSLTAVLIVFLIGRISCADRPIKLTSKYSYRFFTKYCSTFDGSFTCLVFSSFFFSYSPITN
jgi:hypothetical protein